MNLFLIYLALLLQPPENPCKKVFIDEYFACMKDFKAEETCNAYATNEAMACILGEDDAW